MKAKIHWLGLYLNFHYFSNSENYYTGIDSCQTFNLRMINTPIRNEWQWNFFSHSKKSSGKLPSWRTASSFVFFKVTNQLCLKWAVLKWISSHALISNYSFSFQENIWFQIFSCFKANSKKMRVDSIKFNSS